MKQTGQPHLREEAMGRVWIVSELYYPETTSTGYILTGIAEGLAAEFPVHVLCGQPSYAAKGIRAPKHELHNGVKIERCSGTTWDKNVLWKRLANAITLGCSLFFRTLIRLRRGDTVLAVTTPPHLPFLTALACAVRRARHILLVYDKFPEAFVVAGLMKPHSLAVKGFGRCVRRLFRSSERIVTLGRDMQALVQEQADGDPRRVVVIPNWADVDTVVPQPRSESRLLRECGLLDKFVVQFAGNIGRVQDVESLVKCAEALRDHPKIHFLIIGSGAKKAWLDHAVEEPGHENITILPSFPREASSDILSACDVSISTLMPGMLGLAVPSRACNALAAGKPLVVVAHPDSELACIVREENVGWSAIAGDVASIKEAILDAASTPPEVLADMSRRARRTAESRYRLAGILLAYVDLVKDITAPVHMNRS